MLYLVSSLFSILFSKQFLNILFTLLTRWRWYYCRMVHHVGLSECPHDKCRSCIFDRNIAGMTLSSFHSILIRLGTVSICFIIDECVHFDHLIRWCLPGSFSTVKLLFYSLMAVAWNSLERVRVDFYIWIPECFSYKHLNFLRKGRKNCCYDLHLWIHV